MFSNMVTIVIYFYLQQILITPKSIIIMKETCLHRQHIDLGALMSPFGGFDMPIQYKGIIEEHNAVRDNVGVFDVSHMGESVVKGPDAEKYVNHIFTNDVAGAPDGKIFYGMMLNEDGGTVDDLLVYKRNDNEYFIVYNAANIDEQRVDRAHIAIPDCEHFVRIAGHDGIGDRIWIRTRERLTVDYTASLTILRQLAEIERLAPQPKAVD